jgi:hypothetical protein
VASLHISNFWSLELQGETYTGKHGASTDSTDDPFEITGIDEIESDVGQLATATARTLWDEDSDNPADVLYFWFWADQDCYLQVIGATTNFVVAVEAKVPFVLSANTMLAAANTTAISGSAPSVEAIDSIVAQNNSGNTMNYKFAVIL